MFIRKVLSQFRNDFTAEMECEHCGGTQKLTTGYDDDYYHDHVIPAMKCAQCGKTRHDLMPKFDGTDQNANRGTAT